MADNDTDGLYGPVCEGQAKGEYVYSFTAWPDEACAFNMRAVFQLFDALKARVEMRFSAEGFDRFRASLALHGITLREVERVPYHEPEKVP